MFETIFKIELTAIKTEHILIDKLWSEIASSYSKRNRYYHNLNHLDNLTDELVQINTKLDDWQTMIFSVAYHDIVYNILKQDNEEKSADFAGRRLTLLKIPENKIDVCKDQILATKGHNKSFDNDTNYFIDADLAILGAESNTYQIYTQQIRKEYKFYPDLLYNQGRKKVLNHFLQMDTIYKTQHFSLKYEQQARRNIENELRELKQ